MPAKGMTAEFRSISQQMFIECAKRYIDENRCEPYSVLNLLKWYESRLSAEENRFRRCAGGPAGIHKDRLNFSDEESEVIAAVELMKQESKKRFPTTIDIFRVIKALGYMKSENTG